MSTYKTIILDEDGIDILQTLEEEKNFERELNEIPEGDLIEIGVYMGATAKKMAKRYPDRNIYACDTFEGFVEDARPEDSNAKYKKGDLGEATIEKVRENTKQYPNIKLIKGEFPYSANELKNKKFAFAHLDVDVYRATKESLEFLLPRMTEGGKIIVHDYPAHDGVRRAVDELVEDKKVLGGRQCLIIK